MTGADPAALDEITEQALRQFQSSRGLELTGVCDDHTWAALVEAGFALGDRLLYLTSPLMRGDDVAALQLHLGALGFDAGRVDGILGPVTQHALLEFQRNVGLVADAVCGPDTVAALRRLQPRAGESTVAGVRERQELRRHRRDLSTTRVAVAHPGDAEPLTGLIGADLRRLGSVTAVFGADDWSANAAAVNDFDAHVCLALAVGPEAVCELQYFEAPGFVSASGRQLAGHVAGELPTTPVWPLAATRGMRHPILRETRAPTVLLRIGPASAVAEHRALLSSAAARGVHRWVGDPAGAPESASA